MLRLLVADVNRRSAIVASLTSLPNDVDCSRWCASINDDRTASELARDGARPSMGWAFVKEEAWRLGWSSWSMEPAQEKEARETTSVAKRLNGEPQGVPPSIRSSSMYLSRISAGCTMQGQT